MPQVLRLGYVTAIWGRDWLTEIVFANLANLRDLLHPEIELVIAVAGSEGTKSESLTRKFGYKYVEIANQPLGAKWNGALRALKDEDVAGICVLGSDDLCNEKYFRELAEYVRLGGQLAGLAELYFFDHPTGRLLYWQGYGPPRRGDTVGAGRFVGRKILDQLDWELWPGRLHAGLDKGMRELLANSGHDFIKPLPCRDGGAVVMDIKGYGGMNGLEQIAASGPSMLLGDPRGFFKRNFEPGIASIFFQSSEEKNLCADCQLWSFPQESGEGGPNRDAPQIWHVDHEEYASSVLDFLLACQEAKIEVKSCSLSEFLGKTTSCERKDQFVYGGFSGETLFAMLGTSLPKILDYRSIEDENFRQDALKLPIILASCLEKSHKTLPLPFSFPQGFPCFEQRAHFFVCINKPLLVEQFKLLYAKCDGFSNFNLYYIGTRRQAYEDSNCLIRNYLFPLRSVFKTVIFTPADWPDAAYFLSGGTPGICLGSWPGGIPPNCIIPAESMPEALSAVYRLNIDKKFWETMAARARFFSRRQFELFCAELRKLFE